MTHSYIDKFKERNPEETVNIISKFFSSKNLEIITESNSCSHESKLWSTRFSLRYNGKIILYANGKGVSENFAKASGYAELYERYCNRSYYLNNPFLFNKIIQDSYNEYGYYIDPKEQILTYENAIQYFQDYIKSIEDQDSNEAKIFFSTIFENKFIGVPFKEINNSDIIYLDLRLLFQAKMSTGMATGNNFYEAFNQAMSEVCEHHLVGQYLYDNFDKYYRIDINSIQNQNLIKIINKIKQHGNTIYIYDFSYNLGLPVLMTVLINHFNNTISANIASFPIFEIALERTLTELYQGVVSFKNIKSHGQKPWKVTEPIILDNEDSGSVQMKPAFPERILYDFITVEPNFNVFLKDEKYSNKDIYNYYCDLCQKKQIQLYYYDTSKSKEITAIQLFSPNLTSLTFYKLNQLNNNKNKVYLFLLQLYNFLKEFLSSKTYNHDEFVNIIKTLNNFNSTDYCLLDYLTMNDWFIMHSLVGYKSWDIVKYLLFQDNKIVNSGDILSKSDYLPSISVLCHKYILLNRYCSTQKYTTEELLKIFNILKLPITLEDIQNINDIKYLTQKIIFDTMIEEFNDINFIKIINQDENI